ncbi:MAG: exosortase/archaeosortase family protein, partial [Deltaproteobacteria bacterium]|nr:exosortase/archaeosortase family protein [Deltaproteobacteria bacterium]
MSFRQGIDGISAQISTSGQFRIAALFIVSLSLFFPVLYRLINLWATNPDYSHGFFVLPIAVFMLWRKRSQLVTVELQPSWIGLPVFILSVVSYTISFAANFHTLTHLLMIVILLSLVLFIAGWPLMRLAYLSILFIIFMFPIPESYYILLTNPLKLLITSISAGVINILGIPVYQDGNLLFFADTKLEVAEACSGI